MVKTTSKIEITTTSTADIPDNIDPNTRFILAIVIGILLVIFTTTVVILYHCYFRRRVEKATGTSSIGQLRARNRLRF